MVPVRGSSQRLGATPSERALRPGWQPAPPRPPGPPRGHWVRAVEELLLRDAAADRARRRRRPDAAAALGLQYRPLAGRAAPRGRLTGAVRPPRARRRAAHVR